MFRATGTVNSYTRAFDRCKEFASRWGDITPFPAKPLLAVLYLQYLLESTSSCSTVDAALQGFKWVHETAGLVSLTDSSIVVALKEVSKRILGTIGSNRKEPTPPELLKDIVDSADFLLVCQLEMFASIYCVSWAFSGSTTSVESKEIIFLFIAVSY